MDLRSMNRKQLEKLRADVDKALARLDAAEKKKAIEAAEKAAKAYGFSLSELTGQAASGVAGKVTKPRKARGKVAPKYRNPSEPSQTWTGRGRRPRWVVEALESGKTLEDIAI